MPLGQFAVVHQTKSSYLRCVSLAGYCERQRERKKSTKKFLVLFNRYHWCGAKETRRHEREEREREQPKPLGRVTTRWRNEWEGRSEFRKIARSAVLRITSNRWNSESFSCPLIRMKQTQAHTSNWQLGTSTPCVCVFVWANVNFDSTTKQITTKLNYF